MAPIPLITGAAMAVTGYDAQDAPVWNEQLRLAYLRRINMSEAEQLRTHLKNAFKKLSTADVEDLAAKIEVVRENYKFRYGKLLDYAEFFAGVSISVELENTVPSRGQWKSRTLAEANPWDAFSSTPGSARP
jgi:hypothetical protein